MGAVIEVASKHVKPPKDNQKIAVNGRNNPILARYAVGMLVLYIRM